MATTTTEDNAFAENHSFMDVFGSPGRTKILAAFVSERGRDITVSYVARLAGVSRSTVYNHLEDFEAMGLVEEVERGNSTYWTFNTDNDLAHELYRLEGIALKNREQRE